MPKFFLSLVQFGAFAGCMENAQRHPVGITARGPEGFPVAIISPTQLHYLNPMNKIIRAVMALASFALCSALFAVSADLYVDTSHSMDITVNGDRDADITVVNLDTNQTVATISALTSGGGYSYYYTYYGSTASGVTLTNNGNLSATLTGLPAGNYQITATSWGLQDFSSWSTGNWAEMDLYDPYYGSWVDINVGT